MPPSNTNSQGAIFWDRLRSLFTPDPESGPSGHIPNRGTVLTVCVLISTVVWLIFTLQEPKTVTMEVPTQVVNIPEGQALTELPPSTVSVQVHGARRQLLWLHLNTPVVPINATSNEVNVQEVLNLPQISDVRVENVTPRQVDVPKEERVQQRLPIRNRVEAVLPESHEMLRPPRLEPDSVRVSGARSILAGLEAWPTKPVVLDNVQDSIQATVPLADTLLQLVDRGVQEVTYRALSGKFAEATRELNVEVTGVPSDQNLVALEPSTVRVSYRVLFDQMFQSQRASDFFATVSYDQIRSDTTGYVEPNIHVPTDLYIRDPEPTPRRLRYYTFVSGD